MVILRLLLIFPLLAYAGFRHPLSDEQLITRAPTDNQPPMPLNESSSGVAAKENPLLHPTMAPYQRKPAEIPKFDLGGMNREQLRKFAKEAREIKLPTKEYEIHNRAAEVAKKYEVALTPKVYLGIYDKLFPKFFALNQILTPESEAFIQMQFRRFEALFELHAGDIFFAMSELWHVATNRENPKGKKARDFLFSGEASSRINLPFTNSYLIKNALYSGIETNPYYLGILWDQLSKLRSDLRREVLAEHSKKASWKTLTFKPAWAPTFVSLSEFISKEDWPLIAKTLENQKEYLEEFSLLMAQRENDEDTLKSLVNSKKRETADQANLQLARIEASKGNWEDSEHYFNAIVNRDSQKLSLLSEQAYIDTKLKNWKSSLGKAMALQSEFFKYGFVPEAFVIEAMSRKAMCDYGGAEKAVQNLHQKYDGELADLEVFNTKKLDAQARFVELLELAPKEGARRFARYLAQIPEFQNTQSVVYGWSTEQKKLQSYPWLPHQSIKSPEAWHSFLEFVDKDRQSFRDRGYEKAGKVIAEESRDLAKKLTTILNQSELLQLDIATKASNEIHLQSALNFPVRAPASAPKLPEIKNDWGFRQEVWEDELENMESNMPSRCVEDQSSELSKSENTTDGK